LDRVVTESTHAFCYTWSIELIRSHKAEMETLMAFTLPPLPFAASALASRGMGQETLELHHGKHHQAYVTALNDLVEKNPALKGKSLEELIKLAHANESLAPVFNNAGQHWNHCFFWTCLSPSGGAMPGNLQKKIVADFGSVGKFKETFKTAAVSQFGSGWAWLVLGTDGKLKVTHSPDASSPLASGQGTAILTVDVWEHAYYLDFRNLRPEFVDNFLNRLANYEFADLQLTAG
jgi:superoxide dismutase, Fe-Mn family